jgi:rubrerythrin
MEVRTVSTQLYDLSTRNSDRYEVLARQAERVGDAELTGFYRAMRDEERRNAARASLLFARGAAER